MPIDAELAQKQWIRYAYCRDNGHYDFVLKADKCNRFFIGDQWEKEQRDLLRQQRRPALTINKIISTLSTMFGEQIFQRSEIGFRARTGAPDATAETLTKVFKQISDANQLDWKRSDMFADGVITSRGFLDARIGHTGTLEGEVEISVLNPKNVIIDPDAEEYDPDTWRDVFITKWLTADDIAVLYSPDDAELLRNREAAAYPYGYDSIQLFRDRFGPPVAPVWGGGAGWDFSSVIRSIRVVERQHKMLSRQKHFVVPDTGDSRPIPDDFDRNRIAWYVEKFGFTVTTKLVNRIRWTVTADNVRLHDDWSPYERFTVIPYFPHFRRGTTVGIVEHLIDPQELLNKVSSQELHVVNTTANSGYKVKKGALTNMTADELEQRGAETGLVLEVNGDPDRDVVKIQPNQVPSGLDRISYKAEEHIKTISNVSDSMQGFDREDVAAKAIQTKRQASSSNMAKPLDNLVRSDFMLARHVLDLVQMHYTEERILRITHDKVSGDVEDVPINQVQEDGTILNDLTVGEYDVVISSVPQRETLEDTQFDQAVVLREKLGIPIPDEVIIGASKLMNKAQIIQQMRAASQSPEAQAQQQLAQRAQEAEVAKTEAETAQKHADAGLKQAKAQKEAIAAQKEAATPVDDGAGQAAMAKAQADMQLDRERFAHEQQMAYLDHGLRSQEMQLDAALKVRQHEQDAALKERQAAEKADNDRMQAAAQAAAASKPTPKGETAS